jgi:hypothetical protein
MRYADMLQSAEDLLAEELAANAVDPRLAYPEYTPNLNRGQRAALIKAERDRHIAALQRRVDSLKAGEPQLVSVNEIVRLPEAERIEWLSKPAADRDAAPYLVRVHSDDTVEIGVKWGQNVERQRIAGEGYPVGRWNESGDWTPRVQNPSTGEWKDLDPREIG